MFQSSLLKQKFFPRGRVDPSDQFSYGRRKRSQGWLTVQYRKAGTKDWITICKDKHNLGTDAGEDWLHAQLYTNTSAGTRGAGYIAVSSNASGASASHTTLAGEITTGGLARADATTKDHTPGSNTTTIEHTFTASATHTDVQLSALFNASSSGTMAHEATFTATTLQSNDQLKVTWTITSTF